MKNKKNWWIAGGLLALLLISTFLICMATAETNSERVVFEDSEFLDSYDTAEELDAAIEANTERFIAFAKQYKNRMSVKERNEMLREFQARQREVKRNSNITQWSKTIVRDKIDSILGDFERLKPYLSPSELIGQEMFSATIEDWYANPDSDMSDYPAVFHALSEGRSNCYHEDYTSQRRGQQKASEIYMEYVNYYIDFYHMAVQIAEENAEFSDILLNRNPYAYIGERIFPNAARHAISEELPITRENVEAALRYAIQYML